MTDQPNPSPTPNPTPTPVPGQTTPPPATPPTPAPPAGSDPAAMEALRREAAEARSRIRELESQVAVSADAGKSELERASARAERAEKKLAGLESTVVRQGVATAKNVPVELLAPPASDDKAGLEAHADRLAAWAKGLVDSAIADTGRRRSTVLDVGRGAPVSDKADMNDFIRQGFRK